MRKVYMKPEFEVDMFESSDIITLSVADTGEISANSLNGVNLDDISFGN